jgi:hypothetical protein
LRTCSRPVGAEEEVLRLRGEFPSKEEIPHPGKPSAGLPGEDHGRPLPSRKAARSFAWVDLPLPSRPSRVRRGPPSKARGVVQEDPGEAKAPVKVLGQRLDPEGLRVVVPGVDDVEAPLKGLVEDGVLGLAGDEEVGVHLGKEARARARDDDDRLHLVQSPLVHQGLHPGQLAQAVGHLEEGGGQGKPPLHPHVPGGQVQKAQVPGQDEVVAHLRVGVQGQVGGVEVDPPLEEERKPPFVVAHDGEGPAPEEGRGGPGGSPPPPPGPCGRWPRPRPPPPPPWSPGASPPPAGR